MMNIPYKDIIAKIKDKTELSENEIETKVRAKLDNLAGLISKEGAAHIIANELGVRLIPETNGKLKIKEILSGMRNVEVLGKVTAVYEVREFTSGERQGKVGNFMIGDETGIIRAVAWGSQADELRKLETGKIVKLKGGYIKENNGRNEIHLNDRSQIMFDLKEEDIKELESLELSTGIGASESEPKRKKILDIKDNDYNIELLGTIVQAFEPKFFEICPECSKRARPSEQGFECAVHGRVNPEYSYVMNAVLDDGTDSIRIVCFREQVQEMLGKTAEEIEVYRTNFGEFEAVKHDLLGKIMKFTGRAKKNQMFDRLEFTASKVDRNPDTIKEKELLEQEIKELEEKRKEAESSTAETETHKEKTENNEEYNKESKKSTNSEEKTSTEDIEEEVI